jgi:hypothetical protein
MSSRRELPQLLRNILRLNNRFMMTSVNSLKSMLLTTLDVTLNVLVTVSTKITSPSWRCPLASSTAAVIKQSSS